MLRIAARARALGVALALATAGLGFTGPISASATESPVWQVLVGGGGGPPYASLNRFYPNDITVHPGDMVEFKWQGFHTVTFNPPSNLSLIDFVFTGTPTAKTSLDTPSTFVNGTPVGGGPHEEPPPFKLAIGSQLPAGAYRFHCQLHQFMAGVIRVTRGTLPRTNGENQTLAAKQLAADAARATKLDSNLIRQSAHTEGEALAGAGDRVVGLFNFYPSFYSPSVPNYITVKAGDELTFTTRDRHEPHTVTFGEEPNPSSPFGAVFPSGTGNPNAYDGTSDLNSGFLFDRSMYNFWNLKDSILKAAVPRTEFSVTFTTPGLYPFYCALHGSPHGPNEPGFMSGTIRVLPADGDGAGGGGGGGG